MKRQVAVISKCERGEPEAARSTQLVRPPAQDPLELIVDERELHKLTTSISFEHRLHHRSFRRCVFSIFGIFVSLLGRRVRGAEEPEELIEVVFIDRVLELPYLFECLRNHLQIDGRFGSVGQ